MTVEEVKEKTMEVIRESTETELDLTEDTGLYEDMGLASVEAYVLLGLASVEAYVLLCDLEDTFGIKIPASELRKVGTVGDLCRLVIQLLK